MWARGGFGVVLDAEYGQCFVPQAGNRVVVQVYVRYFDVGGKRVGVDGEAVVVRGDLYTAGLQVLDRLVAAAVAELQLECLGAECLAYQLMPETDAEHRCLALCQLFDLVDDRGH